MYVYIYIYIIYIYIYYIYIYYIYIYIYIHISELTLKNFKYPFVVNVHGCIWATCSESKFIFSVFNYDLL